uniref:Uncharacterized protein n=1 Tax=Eptatretus burgeri TaxID=7764 RepID=A0A8C4Q5U6_EPTBU
MYVFVQLLITVPSYFQLIVGLLLILAELEAREYHHRGRKQKRSITEKNKLCVHLELPQRETNPKYSWNVEDINLRSLSPWNYSKSYKKNRTPQMLWNATCSREHCLGHRFNSVPIVHYTQVLYRHGKHLYLSTEPLVVGCTCVEPRRILQKRSVSM